RLVTEMPRPRQPAPDGYLLLAEGARNIGVAPVFQATQNECLTVDRRETLSLFIHQTLDFLPSHRPPRIAWLPCLSLALVISPPPRGSPSALGHTLCASLKPTGPRFSFPHVGS